MSSLILPRRGGLITPRRYKMDPFLDGGMQGFWGGGSRITGSPASFVFNGTDEVMSAAIASSSPNRKTFTISFWVKHDAMANGTTYGLFEWRTDATNQLDVGLFQSFSVEYVYITAAGIADVFSDDQNFDNGSWHHVVLALDTTQATATNRRKLYVDGSATTINVNDEIEQNADLHFMVNGSTFKFGGGTTDYVDGRLAYVQVVEGAQLQASDFGQTSGTWKHKAYTGSFGTHGYAMDGSAGFRTTTGFDITFTPTNMDASNLDTSDLPGSI